MRLPHLSTMGAAAALVSALGCGLGHDWLLMVAQLTAAGWATSLRIEEAKGGRQ